MPAAPLSEALSALSRFLVADASIGDTLQRVADITVDALPPVDYVGITMLSDQGRPTTSIFTNEDAPEIDAAQYRSGRGPCLDAWRTMSPKRVDDTEDPATEYPEFARSAAEHKMMSILSLPLVAAGKGMGALNLYSPSKNAFGSEELRLGTELATAASVVLANASAYWHAYELSEHLGTAMQSRAVIEQAKGMLMAQTPGLTADDAFDLLVKTSQRENVKLREIAIRIVERNGAEHLVVVPPRT